MKFVVYLSVALALIASSTHAEQQRILRRVIKSTPTATNLGRIRLVTVRSVESGAVTEISGKEAASFGQRSANETAASPIGGTKTKSKPVGQVPSTTPSTSTTSSTTASPATSTSTTTTTSTTTPVPSTTSARPVQVEVQQRKHKASDRQQAGAEVELLSGAPSSWQSMTAVEAPAAMLIATGTRAAQSDLSSSASSHEESSDFLRSSSSTKGENNLAGETFSRIRQSNQQQQVNRQQAYFRPAAFSKTSPTQATKTHWYQTTSTTPRPAPLVQQQQQQEHYEQQNEQYVEQQQQQQVVEYGAAPLGQAEPFAFDFKTEDQSGNGQYRKEESDKNGVVRGSYGYTDANGIYRHVEYVADQNGFRANIKSNEPGLIGETQPASIQLAGASAPRQQAPPAQYVDQGENWNGQTANQQPSADLAVAPPDFESSHKSERIRAPRNYRH